MTGAWTRSSVLLLMSILLAGVGVLTGGFLCAGHLLIVDSQPQRADVGLVLAGHFSRAIYAAELYHQAYVGRIWISRPEREQELTQLDAIGVPYPRYEEISRAILLRKRVPNDRIEIIGDGATSTMNEARVVAALLPKRPEVKSILLITSRFHVRRAEAIFNKVLEPSLGVKLTAVGTPYDGFVADRWWTDRDSTRQVILESAKLLLFWVGGEY